MESTVVSVITQFPSSKDEQDIFVERLIDHVTSGNVDPLKIEVQMANIEQVVKKYRSDDRVNECTLREAEKYSQRSFDLYNSKIEIKEVGTKYNYEDVGHPRYNWVCSEIERLSNIKKDIETVMKAQKEFWVYTDTETGEISEISPLSKKSTTKVVVTVKQKAS